MSRARSKRRTTAKQRSSQRHRSSSVWRWWASGAALLAVSGVVVIGALDERDRTTGGDPGPTAPVLLERTGGSEIGQQAPTFQLTTTDGTQVPVPASRPTVLFFMAAWCNPEMEASALDSIERDLGDRVEIIGVGVDPTESDADLRTFAERIGSRYGYVRDIEGMLTVALDIRTVDSTVVVDETGNIVYRDSIPTDEGTLRRALDAAGAS